MGSVSPRLTQSSPRRRGSSTPRPCGWSRDAAAYWIARSSRAMTPECGALAGTTKGNSVPSPSPSLPRRDDLDLVAGLEMGLGPAALRHDVVVERDREMGAFVVELAEQRVDAGRIDLALLAVHDHAHCITSLSIWPRSTKLSVSSARTGAIRKPWR